MKRQQKLSSFFNTEAMVVEPEKHKDGPQVTQALW